VGAFFWRGGGWGGRRLQLGTRLGEGARGGPSLPVISNPSCLPTPSPPPPRNDQATETEFSYELSKTLAEKAAWDVARAQSRWELVVVNPGLVMGPPMLAEHAGTQSIHIMRRNMRGDLCVG
jgi:nucleoside-diphosphate-sugar epimerase